MEWYPKLRRGARLKFDPVAGQTLLLFPEAALVLNDTAAAIIRLCDGKHAVDAIVEQASDLFSTNVCDKIADEVNKFLSNIQARGLLQ